LGICGHQEELLSEEQLIETTVGEGELCRELRTAAVEWKVNFGDPNRNGGTIRNSRSKIGIQPGNWE